MIFSSHIVILISVAGIMRTTFAVHFLLNMLTGPDPAELKPRKGVSVFDWLTGELLREILEWGSYYRECGSNSEAYFMYDACGPDCSWAVRHFYNRLIA